MPLEPLPEEQERKKPRRKPRRYGSIESRTRMGELLRSYRLSRNITRDNLAKLSGYSPSQITHVEIGERPPSREYLVRICVALKLPVEEIVELTLAYAADSIMLY